MLKLIAAIEKTAKPKVATSPPFPAQWGFFKTDGTEETMLTLTFIANTSF